MNSAFVESSFSMWKSKVCVLRCCRGEAPGRFMSCNVVVANVLDVQIIEMWLWNRSVRFRDNKNNDLKVL